MSSTTRRDFLRTFAAATGAGIGSNIFPPAIRKALAIGPRRHKGTIEDVEHVVILMQENRSFDHYFGTLAGVRGFGDRLPMPAPDAPGMVNRTVWYPADGEWHAARDRALPPRYRNDVRAHARRGHAARLARFAGRLGSTA